ncbi:hypothetical protein E2562_001663 [Oryza meyeriana var. granulata]|uniref:Uncharacterized protein n=1 Tax=Oryza meyeriana var. granulata TaxID=110450 RepID=A0A6G1CCU8_9ORYZ|nr:hypothetical protein E2562_001663 [Oryza meyeriana var. granulata]
MRAKYDRAVNPFEEIAFSFHGGKDSTLRFTTGNYLDRFKSGLEALPKEKPTKAILLGTRNGDPKAS